MAAPEAEMLPSSSIFVLGAALSYRGLNSDAECFAPENI